MAKNSARETSKVKRTTRGKAPLHLTIPCQILEQGKHKMYLFPMCAKKLWSVVKVNQRQEDKEEGYQRAFSASRVKKIARYIDGRNCIPGAILVSFDKAKLSSDGKKLVIKNVEDAGWVIDGQHRLIGAHKAETDIQIPVVAFLNLSAEQQVELFVTINREQKGVPTSLYYDLLKILPRNLSNTEIVQERANDVVTRLRRDVDSPFYQRITVTTSPKQGQLSSTNVIRKLTPHLKRDGRLECFSDDERVGILKNLYKALEQVFPKEYQRVNSVFFRTIGFGAIISALPVILDTTFRITGRNSFRVDTAAETLRLLKGFDFAQWRQMGTGSAAEKQVSEDLRTCLEDESGAVKQKGIEL